MDIFMDKLAQRATAQEIIRANTAADVEELDKLKNQIEEYNECLTKLKALIDEGTGKLAAVQSADSETGSLVEESLEGIKTLQKTVNSLEQRQKKIEEQVGSMDKSVIWQLELMNKSLGEKVDQLSGLTEEKLAEKLSTVEENVHKECVKVYRNVQAVVTEESGKQGEALKENGEKVASARGRLGTVLVFSAVAMAASLAGLLLQILERLGVLPF